MSGIDDNRHISRETDCIGSICPARMLRARPWNGKRSSINDINTQLQERQRKADYKTEYDSDNIDMESKKFLDIIYGWPPNKSISNPFRKGQSLLWLVGNFLNKVVPWLSKHEWIERAFPPPSNPQGNHHSSSSAYLSVWRTTIPHVEQGDSVNHLSLTQLSWQFTKITNNITYHITSQIASLESQITKILTR